MRVRYPRESQQGITLALLLAVLILSAGSAAAQHEDWINLDSADPGTPAEFFVDASESDPGRSVLELKIHGFWVDTKQGDDGREYTQIRVPGLGSLNQTGAPDLPVLRTRLGVVTSAQRAVVTGMEVMAMQSFDGMLIWPQPLEELEPEEGGAPERFAIDWQIYDSDALHPPDPIQVGVELGRLGGVVPTAQVQLQPFSWNPATGVMEVIQHGRWLIEHQGNPGIDAEVGRDRLAMLQAVLPNWEIIGDYVSVNWWYYNADYLIITPEAYHDALLPFINLKKAQGYWIQVRYTENIGTDCEDFRAAIADWYDLAPVERDKYCMLVGDVDVIPTCTSPFLNADDYPDGVASDDPYGSVNGYDLDEEVYVGRLSVDGLEDLTAQLDRIVDYQTSTSLYTNYREVALVAHKEEAPGKYVGAHESVRTAFYNTPPSFQTYYGHLGGVNDDDVIDAIDAGIGLLAYRGHGSSSASFTGWNTLGEYFDGSDIGLLSNSVPPVVWSFACSNSRLSSNDCIAEKWMELGEHGAISYYGATVASYTSSNHELDRQMFQGAYTQGLTIQAQAIEYGEAQMANLAGSSNAWMYLLLGDPSMRIKTHGGLQLQVDLPETLPPGPFELELQFFDAISGLPIHDAVFAMWKPGAGRSDEDEVFDNRYTDAEGRVSLPGVASEGMLYWTLRGADGETALDSIPISDSTAAPEWAGDAHRFWAEPSVTTGGSTLHFSNQRLQDTTIDIFDVSGRHLRALDLSATRETAAWDGRTRDGEKVPAGVYFARITGHEIDETARIVVLR